MTRRRPVSMVDSGDLAARRWANQTRRSTSGTALRPARLRGQQSLGQLVHALDHDGGQRVFESLRARQNNKGQSQGDPLAEKDSP